MGTLGNEDAISNQRLNIVGLERHCDTPRDGKGALLGTGTGPQEDGRGTLWVPLCFTELSMSTGSEAPS